MNTKFLIFMIITIFFLLDCCKNKNATLKEEQLFDKDLSCTEERLSNIDSIYILYFNYEFERVQAVDCDEIKKSIPSMDSIPVFNNKNEIEEYIYDYTGVLDTTITNQKVLKEIEEELSMAKLHKSSGIDARMKCYVKYNNHTIDTLCLTNNPNYGYLNGKPTLFSNKFAYLIRYYSGYYYWFRVKRELEYFDELNDTTFVREKVKNYWGEKY
jgi:hypothetical protein